MSHPRSLLALGSLALLASTAAPASAQWSQQKLLAEVPKASENFGWGVAVDGDTAVVGAPWGGGSARVLERDQGGPGAWGEVIELSPPTFGSFGWDVALSGDTIAVGAANVGSAGEVYVFERDAGGPDAWGQVATVVLPGIGCCLLWLDLDGDTLAVGLPYAGAGGVAYVYDRDNGGAGAWGLTQAVTPSAPAGEFGSSISICGDNLLVGDSNQGTATFFARDLGGPDAWGEVVSFSQGSTFGSSVDVRDDLAVVGSFAANTSGGNTGGALLYAREGSGSWSFLAPVAPSDGAPFDQFASSVELHPDGDTLFVSAPQKDNPGPSQGAVYVFERHLGGIDAWGEAAIHVASNPSGPNVFGFSLSASGAELLVGDIGDDESGSAAGAVYLVEEDSPPEPYCTAGTSASGCSALIAASGTASATAASGFYLTATGVEGNANGLFFFGTSGRQAAPWGNGTSFQCVVPPVKRAGLLTGTGTGGACDGSFSQDLNARWCATCPKPQQNPGPGAVVQAQLWYRDPQTTSNTPTSFSNAVEFTVYP